MVISLHSTFTIKQLEGPELFEEQLPTSFPWYAGVNHDHHSDTVVFTMKDERRSRNSLTIWCKWSLWQLQTQTENLHRTIEKRKQRKLDENQKQEKQNKTEEFFASDITGSSDVQEISVALLRRMIAIYGGSTASKTFITDAALEDI